MKTFEEFTSEVSARLAKGRLEYGDRSFSADPSKLVAELEQEALDLAGWGHILWSRLQGMRNASRRLDTVREPMVYAGARKRHPLTVVQDTREQFEPSFPAGLKVERHALPFADYSAAGLTDVVALELKWSLDDLAACVTSERDRFDSMLRGLSRYPVKALIVAASLEDLHAHRYTSKASPRSILASSWAWAQDYGVPTIWAGDVAGATQAIVWWLERANAKRASA